MKIDDLDLVALEVSIRAANKYYTTLPDELKTVYSKDDLHQDFILKYLQSKDKIDVMHRNYKGYIWTTYRNCFLRICENHKRRREIISKTSLLASLGASGVFRPESET